MPADECAAWCSLPDHYVVCDVDLKHNPGFQTHLDSLIAEKRLLQFHEPLRGLELFAGKLILQVSFNRIFRRKKQVQVVLGQDLHNLDISRLYGPLSGMSQLQLLIGQLKYTVFFINN